MRICCVLIKLSQICHGPEYVHWILNKIALKSQFLVPLALAILLCAAVGMSANFVIIYVFCHEYREELLTV